MRYKWVNVHRKNTRNIQIWNLQSRGGWGRKTLLSYLLPLLASTFHIHGGSLIITFILLFMSLKNQHWKMAELMLMLIMLGGASVCVYVWSADFAIQSIIRKHIMKKLNYKLSCLILSTSFTSTTFRGWSVCER